VGKKGVPVKMAVERTMSGWGTLESEDGVGEGRAVPPNGPSSIIFAEPILALPMG
jgi:hypothetical protein